MEAVLNRCESDPFARSGHPTPMARSRRCGRVVAWWSHRRDHHGLLVVIHAAGECVLAGPGDSADQRTGTGPGLLSFVPAGRDDVGSRVWIKSPLVSHRPPAHRCPGGGCRGIMGRVVDGPCDGTLATDKPLDRMVR